MLRTHFRVLKTGSRVVLASCPLEPSWLLSLLVYEVIDIVSNRVLIPATDLVSISKLVSAFISKALLAV